MGGGAIFRSMARLVSTATAAAIGSSSTSPSSLAFCRVDPSPQSSAQNEGFSSVLSLSSSNEKQIKVLSSSSSSSVVVMDDDQFMEFCYVREGEESLRRQIFFSPPTAEEVEEATKDLHAALRISLPASIDMAETSFTSGILFDGEEDAEEEDDDYNISDQQIMRISRPVAKPSSDIVKPAERSRSVMEAFHLLQTNPKVQDVVKSLASDQAVWKAMLNNEKLRELANDQSSIDGTCEEHSNDENDKHEKGYIGLVNMTSKVYDIVTEKVLGIFQKVLVLLNSIYTSFEKAFLSKENTNALDKTVASCMMLAVAVLLMVFLKRVPK